MHTDPHVAKLRVLILQYAADHNLDSEFVVRACADVLAVTAATLARQQPRAHRTIDGQLESFSALVRQEYPRVLDSLAAFGQRRRS